MKIYVKYNFVEHVEGLDLELFLRLKARYALIE